MTGGADPTKPALSLVGITRRFGRVTALDDATMHVQPGTVHALLGENGAGKTTLMRVAFGLVQPEAGTIALSGKSFRFASPSAALAAGVGMVHQHFTLVPAMTVVENVALGGRGLFSLKKWAARVHEIGERTGLVLDPFARVSELSVGAQQRCEIVKALARDVRVLILDEPTAVLAPSEAQELLRWVNNFALAGHAVVLITHKLRDALAVATNVTVLRLGKSVLNAAVSDTSEDELAGVMLGSIHAIKVAGTTKSSLKEASARDELAVAEIAEIEVPGTLNSDPARVVLRLSNATVLDKQNVMRVNRASLEVRAGEIVGIAAVEGAGQRELLRLLSGRLVQFDGNVSLPAHIGFVPEDRHNDAMLLDRSLVENVALRDAGSREGRMPWHALERATRTIINDLDVRAGGADVEARTLSGGNQQKLVLGRELADQPEALVVENPTRGLDVRAARAVHDALLAARMAGTAVVVYSSDLDEVLSLADRVVVMHAGKLSHVESDRETIGRAMLGA
ncbi:MAG: ABC transporter ATP-binding protein [Gemmatimonadaceae bacterium]